MRAQDVIPARGRTFNVKGFRYGLSEEKVTHVFSQLLPGSFADLWQEERFKKPMLVGRLYVSPEIESVYPEFKACAMNPGKDVPIAIGPFELFIWIRCPKKKKRRAVRRKKQLNSKETSSVSSQSFTVFSAKHSHDIFPSEPFAGLPKKRYLEPSPPHKRVKDCQRTSVFKTEHYHQPCQDLHARILQIEEGAKADPAVQEEAKQRKKRQLAALSRLACMLDCDDHSEDVYFDSPG